MSSTSRADRRRPARQPAARPFPGASPWRESGAAEEDRGRKITPWRRRLPIGIQTFRQIREEGYYYVDKTGYARRLADDAGKHYFLSRPRRFGKSRFGKSRFGKSLFVDTLKKLYEGSEPLFRGLAVHGGWDWSRRLRALYSTVKFADAHIEPTFITGVGKFSKVSLFSDLNNLIDLTLDPDYSAICGYTEADLDAVFAPELPGLDRDEIRCSGGCWPASSTTGIGGTRSPATRATGRACSTPFSRRRWTGVAVEDATSGGRLDLAVRLGETVCLFEFKVAERSGSLPRGSARGTSRMKEGAALAQLKARRYADKYRAPGRAVHLIGVEISAESRDLATFDGTRLRPPGELLRRRQHPVRHGCRTRLRARRNKSASGSGNVGALQYDRA